MNGSRGSRGRKSQLGAVDRLAAKVTLLARGLDMVRKKENLQASKSIVKDVDVYRHLGLIFVRLYCSYVYTFILA